MRARAVYHLCSYVRCLGLLHEDFSRDRLPGVVITHTNMLSSLYEQAQEGREFYTVLLIT